MGWSANIKSDKQITHDEVKKMVKEMPDSISRISVFGKRNQFNDWGWSAGADISVPCGNVLNIGGAYGMSDHLAEETAKYFSDKLKQNGHTVSVEFDW